MTGRPLTTRHNLKLVHLVDVPLEDRLKGYKTVLRQEPTLTEAERAMLFLLAIDPEPEAGGYIAA